MAKYRVVVCCWQHGHENELSMTRRQEEKLSQQIQTLKAVCPTCRNAGHGNQAIFIKEGQTLFNPPKIFACRHGHITCMTAFKRGMLNVTFGNDSESFVNIEGRPEDVQELIDSKDISCHHVRENGRVCSCKLKAVDGYDLTVPTPGNIKTRTRVGDLWDRAGIEPVRQGSYDKNHEYQATRTEIANRERLKRIRERNIPKERHPGKRIDKATKKNYQRRSKDSIELED